LTTWQLHWTLARYRPWLYAGNCLIWSLNGVLPLATGLAMRAVFDNLSGGAPAGANVWTAVAVMTAVAIARMANALVGTYAFSTFWQSIVSLLVRNLMEWLVAAPGTRRLPDSPGEIVNRFRDYIREVLRYLDMWVDLMGGTVFVVVGLAIMAAINPLATLVAALPLAGVLFATSRVGARLRIYRRQAREAAGDVSHFVGETFGAVQAVKAASAEGPMVGHFEGLNEARRKAALRDRLFGELLRSVAVNMASVAIGGVLLLTASSAATLTVGDFALFVSYLSRMTFWVQFVSNVVVQHKRVRVSYDRLIELFEGQPPARLVEHAPVYLNADPPPLPPTPRQPGDRLERIELRGLTFHYPGTDRGIHGIDLAIERGTLTVVTGRIGAGKTTLLRVLLGLLPRDGGEILWNGAPVDDPGSFFVPPRCAYTPQVPRLFSESLRDNVLLGEPDDALRQALRLAVMEHDLAAFPDGLDTLVGPRGVRLSGGQVQRAAAARMFVRRPELLVFDDLSSALDVDTERQLWDRLFERADVTCLVVSHREAVLRRADRIVVLEDGRLESAEPPEDSTWQLRKIRASSPT
jgi:ABC-type multidrug transport system fused ATPase/permease subunit